LAILQTKRQDKYVVLAVDPSYEPEGPEKSDAFGLTLIQNRDQSKVTVARCDAIVGSSGPIQNPATDGLMMAMIVAKHTQSNAIVIVTGDHTIGIGAGQQSGISATRIACERAETHLLYDHPKVLKLTFQSDLDRIGKMNAVEQFLSFDSSGRE